MLIAPLRVAALFAIVTAFAAVPVQAMPGNAAPKFTDPAERFAVMDSDKDGRIVWKEFSAARPNLNENAFKSIDADGDGAVSLDEWKAFSSGHGGMAKTPDMGSMMKAMGGKGMAPAIGPNAIPSDDSSAMPLIMPPQGHSHPAPASSAMPLITPPAAPAKPAASGSMPLIMPPKADK